MSMLKGKLEEKPTHFLLIMIAFTSLTSTVVGGLVKLSYDVLSKSISESKNTFDFITSFPFLWRAALVLVLAHVLLFHLLYLSRAMKVLGERWFP